MKKIYRSLLFTLTFVFVYCFSSCCFYYSYDEFNKDLQKCEIVYVENRYTQDMSSIEILAELNEEQTDAILEYLMEEGLWMELPPTNITGTALRLTYEDHYWILDVGTGIKYTLDGEVLQHTAGIYGDGFFELLSQYAELPEW